MTVRSRSLFSNSFGSLVSSGLLIFNTLLVPAVLVRTINRSEYNLLMTALAMLMFLSVVASSTRGVAPSQLVLAYARTSRWLATRAYARFSFLVMAGTAVVAIVGSEAFIWLDQAHSGQTGIFRFGMYCIVGHALGLLAMGVFCGPAAAQRDFLPDNFAKLWPGLYHLFGIALVWAIQPAEPLVWIFLIYLTSPWVGAALLAVWLKKSLYSGAPEHDPKTQRSLEKSFWAGLLGMSWWNLMSYLAVNAATFIVLLLHPRDIVPFGIATSFLGITSAGLIAVASPITGYAAGLHGRPAEDRRRFFLIVNTLFQVYIISTALVILLIPNVIFVLWLKQELAEQVRLFCLLLLPAYALRQVPVAFTMFVMSVGRQQQVWVTPLVEAMLSVGGGLVLGTFVGVAGIPMALAISSLARIGMTMLYDEPRHAEVIGLRRGDSLWSALTLIGVRR